MKALKQNKAIIRDFMRAHYTDAKLVELLDHARAGKLSFCSCCCFIGIPTADHELRGDAPEGVIGTHYDLAEVLPGALNAEWAFHSLAKARRSEEGDHIRRRILIPMVLAEIRRRAKANALKTVTKEACI